MEPAPTQPTLFFSLNEILALPLPSADWLGLNCFDLSPAVLSHLQRMDKSIAVATAVREIVIFVHNEPQAPEYKGGLAARINPFQKDDILQK